jgi:hypothetical protein
MPRKLCDTALQEMGAFEERSGGAETLRASAAGCSGGDANGSGDSFRLLDYGWLQVTRCGCKVTCAVYWVTSRAGPAAAYGAFVRAAATCSFGLILRAVLRCVASCSAARDAPQRNVHPHQLFHQWLR